MQGESSGTESKLLLMPLEYNDILYFPTGQMLFTLEGLCKNISLTAASAQ